MHRTGVLCVFCCPVVMFGIARIIAGNCNNTDENKYTDDISHFFI